MPSQSARQRDPHRSAVIPPSPATSTSPPHRPGGLEALRGLRSAPFLDAGARERLRRELAEAMAPCAWFTIGVMAPSAATALAALRSCEQVLGWPPLQPQELAIEAPDDQDRPYADPDGTVFLKGNQRAGTFLLRPERGLGEGILISGHHLDDPSRGDTWGPLPLDLFARVDA
jgi:hypothetical protein